VHKCNVSSSVEIGDIILVKLQKQKGGLLHHWFCSSLTVKGTNGTVYSFPCYSWFYDSGVLELREGTAKKSNEDTLSVLKKHRKNELAQRKKEYKWTTLIKGIPRCSDIVDVSKIPPNMQFSFTKNMEFKLNSIIAKVEMCFEGHDLIRESWEILEKLMKAVHIKQLTVENGWLYFKNILHEAQEKLIPKLNKLSTKKQWPKWFNREYVKKHWQEDAFFGYQYLNGTNTTLIRRCDAIPANFPVTSKMVSPFLDKSLEVELKAGNLFLVDYKLLDGIKGNVLKKIQQYVPAPLCLLYKKADGNLVPIAIQLKQKPGSENPIFLPNDSVDNWLLAKVLVRSADFNYFEWITHLLRTHLMAEVFCLATMRQLPSVHPLFKLLIPHTRYTLQINTMARTFLINKGGIFDRAFSTGGPAKKTVLQRGFESLTYSAFCVPDDIKVRGVENVPNYYYRDDAQELWAIINEFVVKLVSYYYKSNTDVKKDSELQAWVQDIFQALLSRKSLGNSIEELTKFLTMVIFTCSAQHNAGNAGQYDFSVCLPNASSTLRRPPPTSKTSRVDYRGWIADAQSAVNSRATTWVLTRPSHDPVFLGQYPEERFTEDIPKKLIKEFQSEMQKCDERIKKRNEKLDLPYTYLLPSATENSVSL
ncbi:ALOX8 lipoxygenase, partial [Amia calva]|nr:ALOX8 lipoxygenase [Amia calva]